MLSKISWVAIVGLNLKGIIEDLMNGATDIGSTVKLSDKPRVVLGLGTHRASSEINMQSRKDTIV